MKRTLLNLTQTILSRMSSDEVNSISDTVESLQVADIIKTVYYNMIARQDFPEHNELFQLTPSVDNTQPVLMFKPDSVSKIEWIKYFDNDTLVTQTTDDHDIDLDLVDVDGGADGSAPSYKYVTILPVRQFLDMTNEFNTNETNNVDTFTFTDSHSNTFTFNYKFDKTPQYCCVISDYYIIFDSYDSVVDSTLQASKTMCFGQVIPTFLMEDTFIPDLDDQQVPLLLNEATSLAFLELKQMVHQKAEQESKRQWSSLQKTKSLVNKPGYFNELPNFGRTSGKPWRN